MKTRKEVEDSFKDLIVPSGRDDLRVNLELLLDVRELLQEIIEMKKFERGVENVRKNRELARALRESKVDNDEDMVELS